jgi:hypothetical protein
VSSRSARSPLAASERGQWFDERLDRRGRDVRTRALVVGSAVLAAISIALEHRYAGAADLWWTSLVPLALAAWTAAILPTAAVLVVSGATRLAALLSRPGVADAAELADVAVQTLVAVVIAGSERITAS